MKNPQHALKLGNMQHQSLNVLHEAIRKWAFTLHLGGNTFGIIHALEKKHVGTRYACV